MNSSIDLHAAGSSVVSSLPLSFLRVIELAVLKRRYAQFVWVRPEQDRWFVYSDNGTFGPVRFIEALQRLVQGESPLAILHEDEANREPEPWQTIAYRSCVLDRATKWTWIVAFWTAAIFLGWVAVSTFGPQFMQPALQWIYFIGAIAALAWFSLPDSIRARIRPKHS
jgi:hypothetical protein